jgi:hypothetical protein
MQASHPIRVSSATIIDDVAFTLCLSTFAIALAVFSAYVFVNEPAADGHDAGSSQRTRLSAAPG